MLLFSAVVVFGQEKYKLGLAAMQKRQYQQAISYFNQQKREPNVSAKTIKDCQTQIAECERQIKLKAQREQEQREQARREQEAIEAKQRRVVNEQGILYVYFPNGKYDLSSEQKRDIKSYVETIGALHKDVSLKIIGCCNAAEGSASSHQRLAHQRTDAVLNVIKSCNGNYMIEEKILGGTSEYSITDKSKNDVVVINTYFRIDGGSNNSNKPSVEAKPVEEEVEVDEEIPFAIVEDKPMFQGKDANEFTKWVYNNIEYPEIAKENGIQGRVTVQFTIDKDGSVKDVKVLRGVDSSLDKEAVRVIQKSPKWSPGKQRKKPVKVKYTFPIIFQLQ